MSEYTPADESTVDLREIGNAIWRKKLRIFLVTVILCAVTYGVLMFVPNQYESSASALVEARDNAFTRATSDTTTTNTAVLDEALMASQVELIKSRDTLLQVINSEGLRDVPEFNGTQSSILSLLLSAVFPRNSQLSLDEITIQNVRDHLTVIQERDSRVISILFRSEDPELAARVANAIARAHVRRRANLSLEDTAEVSQWLESEIDSLRSRVNEAEAAVAAYRVENDLFIGTNNENLLDQQLSNMAAQITEAQQRKSDAHSRATLIRGLLDAGQPIDGISDVRESVVVQQLLEEKARVQAERAQRLATLLPDHPQVQQLTAQITEIDAQILAEGRRVADALEAEARIEADLEQSLRDELTRLKIDASAATRDGVTLGELEREAAAQRDLLETYLARYREATSRTDQNASLPDVRVVSEAAPSFVPASPKTMLILLAVAFGSVTLQIGSILFGELATGRAVAEAAPNLRYRPSARAPEDDHERDADRKFERGGGEPAGRVSQAEEAEEHRMDEMEDERPVPRPAHVPVREARQVWRGIPDVDDTASPRRSERSPAGPPPYAPPPPERAPQYVPQTDPRGEWAGEYPAGGPAYPPAQMPQHERHDQDTGYTREAVYGRDADPNYGSGQVPPYGAWGTEQSAPQHWSPEEHDPNRFERRQVPLPPTAAYHEEPPASRRAAPGALQDFRSELDGISRQVVRGRVSVVILAAITSNRDCIEVADRLIGDALEAGLSVARVDAGSSRMSTDYGVTDLSAGIAEFGEVVHSTPHEGLGEVPWGRQAVLDRRSPKPATLIDALSDIYDVVIVLAGRVGMASSLPVFADADGALVIVAPPNASLQDIETAEDDAAAIGFARSRVVLAPGSSAEVA